MAEDEPRHGPGLGPRLPGNLLLLRSVRRRIPVVMCPAPLVALPEKPASWCAGTLIRRQPSQTLSWPLPGLTPIAAGQVPIAHVRKESRPLAQDHDGSQEPLEPPKAKPRGPSEPSTTRDP